MDVDGSRDGGSAEQHTSAPRTEYSEYRSITSSGDLRSFVSSPIQEVVRGKMIKIPKRQLDIELTCPVCLGILRETEVSPCMHRFCGECIQKCLRLRFSHCPTCRVHLSSRRSLKRDKTFDELINLIYPNIEEYMEEETKYLRESTEKFLVDPKTKKMMKAMARSSSDSSDPSSTSHSESMESNSMVPSKIRKLNDREGSSRPSVSASPSPPNASSSRSEKEQDQSNDIQNPRDAMKMAAAAAASFAASHGALAARQRDPQKDSIRAPFIPATPQSDRQITQPIIVKPSTGAGDSDPIEYVAFILKKHPLEYSLPELKEQYILTSPKFSTLHIKRYLEKKLELSNINDLEIWYATPDLRQINIRDKSTLADMFMEWEKGDFSNVLVLHYRSKKSELRQYL